MVGSFDIEMVREAAVEGRVHWHKHALERILERGIALAEIIHVLINGEIIEVYPSDRPYASGLVYYAEPQPVHVVVSVDPKARICHVITAYRPDLEHFQPDFKTRRKGS